MIGIWWNLRLIHGPTISGPHLTSGRCPHRTRCPPAGGCRGGAVAVAVESEEEVNCKSISTLTSPLPHHRTRRWLPNPLSVFTQLLRVLFCQIKLKLVKFVKMFSMFRSDFILVHHKLPTYFQRRCCYHVSRVRYPHHLAHRGKQIIFYSRSLNK